MARETYTIGDGVIDYLARCYASDNKTPIDALDVGGVPQISHEATLMRQGNPIQLPLATDAIVDSKPPGALVGQTPIVLQEADLDIPLEHDDDIYIYTTFETAQGPKTTLMVIDVIDPSFGSTIERVDLDLVFPQQLRAGEPFPSLFFDFLPDGENAVTITADQPLAYLPPVAADFDPDLQIPNPWTPGNETNGMASQTEFTSDGSIFEGAESGGAILFNVQSERQGVTTNRQLIIPFEAVIIGAGFVLS